VAGGSLGGAPCAYRRHAGNHWSPAKIASTFAPSEDTVNVVTEWLTSSGVHPERIKLTAGKAWLELKSVLPRFPVFRIHQC
jgi:hypothetical protein